MSVRIALIVCALGAVLPCRLAAQESNLQEIIPIDDPVYAYLDLVYLESGLAQPSAFRPYSAQEFLEYVERVQVSRLSRRGRSLLELVKERIRPDILSSQDGQFGFAGGLETSLEYYAKRESHSDYIFTRHDRLPIATIPLELWFFDSAYANSTFVLEEDYRLSAGRWEDVSYARGEGSVHPVHGNRFNWFSAEANVLELDWYFPFRALISVGGSNWHLTYGRDYLNVGNGTTGNLFLSDYPDYYDSLILSTHWRFFKGTAAYIYFEPWLTADDRERLDSGEYFTRIRDYDLPYKAMMIHQLEFRPLVNFPDLPQLGIFAAEGIMFGTQYPQIRDFNPMMIFHNWFEYERTNDTFYLGFNLVPVPRIELYGQYHMNEFDTAYEGGGNFPGASGWLGGVRGMLATDVGIFSAYAEYVLTDPLLYNRYHPLLKITTRRRIWSYVEPDQFIYVDKPIGYYTGPDTELVSASVGYRLPPQVEARVAYSSITKGEKNLDSPYEETPGEETPTGTPWISHIVEAHADYTPVPIVSFGGALYLVWDRNAGHTPGADGFDVQGRISVTLRLGNGELAATREALGGVR